MKILHENYKILSLAAGHTDGLPIYVLFYMTATAAAKKKKYKTVPLQAWSGSEGSRKLKFQDFLRAAQDGGKVVSLTHRAHLPPGNAPGTHFC
jgi:hypothetical protein